MKPAKKSSALSGLKAIGLFIIVYILYSLNIRETLHKLQNINIILYLAGLSLFIPMLFIKAFRWRYLLNTHEIKITRTEAVVLYASGMFVGTITPGRVGEIIKAWYIKAKGYSSARAFSSVLEDRLFDILFLLFIGLVSILFFMDILQNTLKTALLTLSVMLFCVCVPLFITKIWRKPVIIKKYLSSSLTSQIELLVEDFKKLRFRHVLDVTSLTALSWLIYFLQMLLFAKSIDLHIAFLDLSAAVSIATIVSLLPISIEGIGTRDAALVFIFTKMGHTREAAIAFSALILLMLAVNVCICAAGWFFNRQRPHLRTLKNI